MKFILLLILILSSGFAAPAFNKTKKFYNNDGSFFYGVAAGNQHLNWIQAEDGSIVVFNSQSKDFEYAIVTDETIIPNNIKYSKNNSKIKKANSRNILSQIYKLLKKKQQIH